MWFRKEPGDKIFTGGREAWAAAAAVAGDCTSFRADDEDEQCAEEPFSCYNCRYRRWTADSFACLAL